MASVNSAHQRADHAARQAAIGRTNRTPPAAPAAQERPLDVCRQHGRLAAGGRQRTDSTHVLAAVRVLNRMGCARQALRLVLNALAEVAPAWLRAWVPAEWADRRGGRRSQHAREPESLLQEPAHVN